ncbi:MAG: ABC transporter ATP-binding protein [Methanolinea sp.]|jgi:iron complex transport system ATP-binding protein|nr:ABC transporter ATP-binding protein [Methanolinea sp.]
MIDVSGVELGYGAQVVLSDVSFRSGKGEFLGIVGPNGSGKTTLLKAIARLVAPLRGVVMINGQEIEVFSAIGLSRLVGLVPQASAPGFEYSVRDVVMMGRYPHIGMFGGETPADRDAVRKAMEVTGIAPLADRSVREISGGELQRVIIARALAQEPEILLLDEATAHLDLGHQVSILQMIRELSRRIAVIGVFHDLNHAAYFCDRIILLHDHRILAMGDPAGVLTEENIARAFGVRAMVRINPLSGRPVVSPVLHPSCEAGKDSHVHVVCGGGEGAGVLVALRDGGYRVTAGVLSLNDSDYLAAEALGIPCLTEPPFCPISERSRRDLEVWARDADAIVVTRGPWGTGNIENLRVLSALDAGAVVIMGVSSWDGRKWDYTGGDAEKILSSLKEKGARVAADIPAALGAVREITGETR